jgi:lipopolysaccharide/colanic/teichoic acid biosynthesis glycosyltransferase/glycosyltransferase involved in cell wall biosynthesis
MHGTSARTLSFGYADRHVSITLTHHVPDEQVRAPGPSPRRPTRYERYVKRPVDIVGSAILLLLMAPLMLAITIGVRVTMGHPVIFRQVRLTRGGRPFTMYKFRSMLPEWAVPDDVAGPSGFHAADDSLRHTPFGRFIRRFALDELPQLWNVLKGDMSLVGPRPELPEVAAAFDLIDHPRHLVRSGMTGAWQVSENRDGFVHLNVEIDEEYVGDLTFHRDVTIVLRTFAVLVGRTPRNQPGESNGAAAPAVIRLIPPRDAPSCRSERSDSGSQTVAAVSANPDAADATDMQPAIGIRLLHVLEPRIAGVPAYVDALGRALANRGVEQHVLAAAADGGPGIQLWPFDAWADSLTHRRWSRRPVDAYRIAAEIRHLIASKGIDLVHAHATFAGIAARIRHLDVPLIYQPHGWGHLSTQTAVGARIVRLVERILDPRTDLLLTLSTHEGHDAPPGRSITQVRPVVDLTRFGSLDDEERQQIRAAQGWAACERVHLCVGELSHRKNQVALARCWRDSAPEGNRLVFVGDGPERARVEREGGSRVDVVGWRRDIPRIMGAADTLVVASRGEGFSLVILEALATGLPVFTTDVGGSEAVSPNMGAVCGSVRDVVAAATTSTLPDGPSSGRAHRAQLTRAEWSVDKAADEFLAIFRSARAKRDASPVGSRARTVVINGIRPSTSPSTTSRADHGNGSSENPNMPPLPLTSMLPAPNGVMPSTRATRSWNWRRKPGREPLNGARS